MKVVIKQPGQPAFSQDIEDVYYELERFVGGKMEGYALPCGIVLLVNKELDGFDAHPNFSIYGRPILGPAVFAAICGVHLIGLYDFQVQAILGFFHKPWKDADCSKDTWTFYI